VLYYGDDATLLLISRHRALLEPRFRLNLPEPELIETLVDKTRFAAMAQSLELPAPRTMISREVQAARDVVVSLRGPWIVKPHCHVGWQAARGAGKPFKALRADDERELSRVLDQVRSFSSDFVVQELIPGGEEQIYSFHAYVDAERRPLGHFVGRKIRTYPMSAGVSTFIELVDEPELSRVGLDVIERVGLVGIAKLDFKRDLRTGRFHLLEINPRYNLWHHLGSACGVNLPLIAYRDLTGQKVEPETRYKTGVRWLSFGNDARAFARDYAPAGELSWVDWVRSFRGPMIYELFDWDDASPFVMNLMRGLRQRGRKLGPAIWGSVFG
jgi:predicted ATP-grasp superfamily ATP-dependent carboligase